MILRTGVDLIEIDRVAEVIARHGKRYLERIYTPAELEQCGKRTESLAGRFAAKEAVLKALGTGWRDGLAFADIEIRNDERGQPQVIPHGKVKEFLDHHRIDGTSVLPGVMGVEAFAEAALLQRLATPQRLVGVLAGPPAVVFLRPEALERE